MGREPVHSESNMMKLTILTLAAITVVIGAPIVPERNHPEERKIENMIEKRSAKEDVIESRFPSGAAEYQAYRGFPQIS